MKYLYILPASFAHSNPALAFAAESELSRWSLFQYTIRHLVMMVQHLFFSNPTKRRHYKLLCLVTRLHNLPFLISSQFCHILASEEIKTAYFRHFSSLFSKTKTTKKAGTRSTHAPDPGKKLSHTALTAFHTAFANFSSTSIFSPSILISNPSSFPSSNSSQPNSSTIALISSSSFQILFMHPLPLLPF